MRPMKRGRFACLYWIFIVLLVAVNGESSDGEVVRINCGGPAFVDHFNRTWAADSSYVGGLPANSTASGAQLLLQDNLLYATTREWAPTDYVGSYNISVAAPGYFWAYRAYTVANPAVPYFLEFSVPVYGSAVVVSLTAITAAMHISAIEVARHYPGLYRNNVNTPMMMRTITRLDMGGDPAPFLDSEGRTWEPDVPLMYVNNRTSSTRVGPAVQVAGTGSSPDFLPLRVLQTATTIAAQNLTGVGLYIVVPVLGASYHTARLHFAEVQGLTAGQRVMNVYVNDELVYAGLDVVRLAGPSKAMFLDFNVEPVPAATSRTINITVINVPTSPVQEPLLSALEVFRHSPLPQVFDPFPDGTLRINCGGEAMVSAAGFPYVADRYFSGGVAVPASLAKFALLAREQDNNQALQVAASYREFSGETLNYYRIPVPRPGLYLVRLLFAELEYSNVYYRAFTVQFQDTAVLINYNSAYPAFATTKAVHLPVTTPNLTIAFNRGLFGAPYINAIEVYPAPEGQYREAVTTPSLLFTSVRINVGGDGIGDSQGRVWIADDDGLWYSQQRSVVFTRQANISNLNATLDRLPAGIYQSFRKAPGGQPTDPPARLTYIQSLTSRDWVLVRLHFAEIELSLPGDRLLDIRINNQGLDIVRQVGPNAGMHRDFVVQIEDPLGDLVVEVVANTRGRVVEPILSAFEIFVLIEMLPAPPSPPGALHINCGGGAYKNARNVQWSEDAYFEGGTAVAATDNATALLVSTSQDAPVVASYREWPRGGGVGNYVIPADKGTYLIRVHFAELKYANTSLRHLAFVINDNPVGVSYTPSTFASHEQFEYVVAVPGPNLTLSFASVDSTPYVNAIEVVPMPAASYFSTIVAPPTELWAYRRWNVGGKDVVDSLGRRFFGDDPNFYEPPASTALYSVSNDVVIGGADVSPSYVPAALLRSGRRALPLALNQSSSSSSGTPTISMPLRLPSNLTFYLLRLHFCEVEYAAAGVRVMDILINGFVAYEKLDVMVEAGANASLYKDFNVQGDGTGLLLVQIRASTASKVQQPMLSAVEMLRHDQLSQPPPTRSDEAAVVRINCGGGVTTDSYGRQWLPDRFYKGGQAVQAKPSMMATMYSTVGFHAHLLASQRTWPQDVLGGSYIIPLSQPGLYWVAAAPAGMYRETYTAPITSVVVERYNIGGNSLMDSQGRTWHLDNRVNDLKNHTTTLWATRPVAVRAEAGDYEQSLYQSARISKSATKGGIVVPTSLSKVLSVRFLGSGSFFFFLVRLHFAELQYLRAGDRVMDILLNGQVVRSGLDLVKEVGPMSATYVDFKVQADTSNAVTYEVRPSNGSRVQEALLCGVELLTSIFVAGNFSFTRFNLSVFEFCAPVSGTNLSITLVPLTGQPVISAIEVAAAPAGMYRETYTAPITSVVVERYNIGGNSLMDSQGRTWHLDNRVNDLKNHTTTLWATRPVAVRAEAGDYEQSLYQSARISKSATKGGIVVPTSLSKVLSVRFLGSGSFFFFLVRLHFAELQYLRAGDRVMDILLNGQVVRSGLDLVKEVGPMSATYVDFKVQADTSNAVTYEVRPSNGSRVQEALLCGVELLTSIFVAPPLSLKGAIRINCGGQEYTDPAGNLWAADDYFSSGVAMSASRKNIQRQLSQMVNNAELYASYRYWPGGANNSYNIPIESAPGLYLVRVYYGEFEFSSPLLRSYSILLNGFLVMSQLNPPEAGVTYYDEFSLAVPGPNLTITFSRSIGNPMVSAIEHQQEEEEDAEEPMACTLSFDTRNVDRQWAAGGRAAFFLPALCFPSKQKTCWCIVTQPEGLFNQTTTTKDILQLFGPNRKNIGGPQHMDPSGRTWLLDDPMQYTNPNTTTNTVPVPISGTGEAPQFLPLAVYQSERLVREEHLGPDGLSTSIAVKSSHKFVVRLHFAELTVEDVGGRVLDIYINEQLVLSGLDVVKEVGPRAALFRDFRVNLGASSSTIRVRIMPSPGSRLQEPKLNALELQDVLPGPEAPPAASKGFSTGAIAGTAVGACVLAAVLLLAAIVWGRRRYNQQGPLDLEGQRLLSKLKAGTVQYIPLTELEKATDNFSDANSMGAGGFATVYKGQGPNDKLWAVKRANKATQQGFKDFAEEIFVYEFMPNATVDDWLHPKQGSGRQPLTFEQRLIIAVGAARGLSYLHSFANNAKEAIIHRDVKAENILLDAKLQAKVADFGLLKRVGNGVDKLSTAQLAGTRGYMDPEYFSTFQLTPKSDVYSFGVVLLELCTGKRPTWKDLENPEETKSLIAWVKWNLSTLGWTSVIDPTMGEFSEQALAHVIELAFDCVKLGAADRPSMAQVATRLEEIASGEAHLQYMDSSEPLIRRAGGSTGLHSSGLASHPSSGSMGPEAPMLGSEGTSAISVPFVSEVTPR
eukprot:jgi/Mesen1/1258/ME000129S00356